MLERKPVELNEQLGVTTVVIATSRSQPWQHIRVFQ